MTSPSAALEPAAHARMHRSLTAAAEKRALVWMAERVPAWVSSDHLSALGFLSMAGVGASFWLAGSRPAVGLPLVVLCLVLPGVRNLALERTDGSLIEFYTDVSREWMAWLWIGILAGGQALLLFLSVDGSWRKLKPRRHLLVSVATAATTRRSSSRWRARIR